MQRWDQVDHMSYLIKWERHEKRRIQQKQGQEASYMNIVSQTHDFCFGFSEHDMVFSPRSLHV